MALTETKIIDADAHVVETERVWDFLDGADKKYRPALTASPETQRDRSGCLTAKTWGSSFLRPIRSNPASPCEKIRAGGRDSGRGARTVRYHAALVSYG